MLLHSRRLRRSVLSERRPPTQPLPFASCGLGCNGAGTQLRVTSGESAHCITCPQTNPNSSDVEVVDLRFSPDFLVSLPGGKAWTRNWTTAKNDCTPLLCPPLTPAPPSLSGKRSPTAKERREPKPHGPLSGFACPMNESGSCSILVLSTRWLDLTLYDLPRPARWP